MDSTLRTRFTQLLSPVPRLAADAQRLVGHVRAIADLKLTAKPVDLDLLTVACHALQLPMGDPQSLPVGKFGQLNLRHRAERAAEMLVVELGAHLDEPTLDRATRVLLDLPNRSPESDDARVLADAVNLDDFGLAGLLATAVQLGARGQGVDALLEGAHKRDQYGYWEARLRDGFHFPPVRAMAERKLVALREVLARLT